VPGDVDGIRPIGVESGSFLGVQLALEHRGRDAAPGARNRGHQRRRAAADDRYGRHVLLLFMAFGTSVAFHNVRVGGAS
jgi:hypothetical protein